MKDNNDRKMNEQDVKQALAGQLDDAAPRSDLWSTIESAVSPPVSKPRRWRLSPALGFTAAALVIFSVFSFTVLSTGLFASERSKETVFAGLEEAKSSIEVRGSVMAYKGKVGSTETIFKVVFVVTNAVAGEPIDLTAPYTAGGSENDPEIISNAEYKIVISYIDNDQYIHSVPWTLAWIGNDNGDSLLEEGEKAEITVWLLRRDFVAQAIDPTANSGVDYYATADANGARGMLSTDTLLGSNGQFTIEVKPEIGAVLTIQRTAPSRLDTIMDLK